MIWISILWKQKKQNKTKNNMAAANVSYDAIRARRILLRVNFIRCSEGFYKSSFLFIFISFSFFFFFFFYLAPATDLATGVIRSCYLCFFGPGSAVKYEVISYCITYDDNVSAGWRGCQMYKKKKKKKRKEKKNLHTYVKQFLRPGFHNEINLVLWFFVPFSRIFFAFQEHQDSFFSLSFLSLLILLPFSFFPFPLPSVLFFFILPTFI